MNVLRPYIKVFLQMVLLFGAYPLQAQTSSMNYVRARAPRTQIRSQTDLDTKTTANDSVMTTVQYIDGLGRPIQTVIYQASPLNKDIVQPMAYDTLGRELFKYLPYTATSADGSYKTDALTTGTGIFSFYKPTGVTTAQQTNGIVLTADPFSVTGFEPSPLNRVVEQGAPGENFQLTPGTGDPNSSKQTSKVDYLSNDLIAFVPGNITDNPGDHMVALYTATINPDQSRTLARIGNNAYYAAGQLELTITKSENWNVNTHDGCIGITEEYKDKEGHMVLRRTYDKVSPTTLEEISTYYVYDDFGNLCFVLPPGSSPDANAAITTTTMDNQAYQYRYDPKNRLTQKKLPGKGWEFIVYNTLDQVVMTQTANQRNQTPQQWTFTKYDAQGRVVITGLWPYTVLTAGTNSTADANLDTPSQTYLAWLTNYFATTTQSKWESPSSGTSSGYDGQSDPLGQSYTFLTINYYDTYSGIPGFPSNFVNSTYSTMTTGLPTASKVYVLNTTDALWSVSYYNDLGLPVRTFKQHYLGGTTSLSQNNYDDVTTTYNFNRQPLTATRMHYDNVSNVKTLILTSADTYTYDHMGRKINSYNQVTDHAKTPQVKILVSQNVYNEIGQLMTKKLNARSPFTTFLQSVDYRYTARGWLSTINNSDLNMTDATTNTTTGNTDIFGEE